MKHIASLLCVLLLAASCAHASVLPAEGVQQSFLEFTGLSGKRAVVLCESLSICDERNGRAIHKLYYGDTFITTEGWDGWADCFYSDGASRGWVRSDYIMVDPAYYVTDDAVQVYAYGDTMAPRVALLDKGVKLPILHDAGEWFIISLRGAAGWIRKTPADTVSQTGFRPEMLSSLMAAQLDLNGQSYRLTDPASLGTLAQLLTSTHDMGGPMAGCPFSASLQLLLTDGQLIVLELATDSCCVYRIDSRDYQYARYLKTGDSGVDNTCLFSLFGVQLTY